MSSGFLLPDVDDPQSRPFWDGCAAGELLVQACADCGLQRMPPRPMCPACQSRRDVWQPSDGFGSVWSFVVPHPPLLPAYAALAPYNVIVVALDEAAMIRFTGNLVEPAPAGWREPSAQSGGWRGVDPASIRIGEPVRVVFETVDGVSVPRWIRR